MTVNGGKYMIDCRNCEKWESCPCGKEGHENGTSIGYSIGECKEYSKKQVPCSECKKKNKTECPWYDFPFHIASCADGERI